MKLLVESDFPFDAKTCWELFESEEFDARLEEAANITCKLLKAETEGDIVVRHLEFTSKTELPTVVRKALGMDKLTYKQINRFDPGKGSMTWTVQLPVLQDRVSVGGTTTIVDTASGCHRVVDGDISVRMRFVGGTIEKGVVAEFEKSMSRAVQLVRDLARERGLS